MKHPLTIIMTILVALAATGCIGRVVDWYPVEFTIYVQDQNGNSLLDPESENYIAEGAKAEWRGEEHELKPETKFYMPYFQGLLLKTDGEGVNYLYFGELDGSDDYNDDLMIHWKNGVTSVIHYKRSVNSMLIKANVKRKLNGNKIEDKGPITIVIDSDAVFKE